MGTPSVQGEATAASPTDPTESIRRQMIETGQPRQDLASNQGESWDTGRLQQDFEVIGFAAPFVVVRRRADGEKGTLEFTHSPRVYFGWHADA